MIVSYKLLEGDTYIVLLTFRLLAVNCHLLIRQLQVSTNFQFVEFTLMLSSIGSREVLLLFVQLTAAQLLVDSKL